MTHSHYEPIALRAESTIVAEFIPDAHTAATYQSKAALEHEFVCLLEALAYERLRNPGRPSRPH